MINLVDINFKAPKELNDVRVALIELTQALKDGGGLAAVLGKLGLLMTAIDGLQTIPEEFKEELKKSLELSGFMGGELVGVLLESKKAT